MAGTFPFEALPRRMTRAGESMRKAVTILVREVATGIGTTLVNFTPVDTGKARSNWRATITQPASGVIPAYSPGFKLGIGEGANASAAKAQHKQVFARYNAGKHPGVFLTNNVPYIGLLDAGSSGQSPGGMVKLGLQTGRVIVQTKARGILDRV